jgi:hypothetical protein
MNLSEFRRDYGQNVAMTVCRTAYGYVLNGHEPKTSLKVAASLYAQKFLNHRLKCISYRVEKELGCVRIYQLHTETEFAQRALRSGKWNYDDTTLCIASLGENYRQHLVRTIEYSDDLVVSVYEHFGRFVSVVALEGCKKPSQVEKFNRIGHVLAVNAVGYYDRYLDAMTLINTPNTDTELGRIDKYLSSQNIEIKHGKYYNGPGFFPSSRKGERISHYLKRKQAELETDIRIADICVFGNF